MTLRAITIYVATFVMVCLGEKRFLGKNTAFVVILGIILGSVVSRAINGSAPFFPTLVGGFALVSLHWLFAVIALHSDHLGVLFKGNPCTLIRDGEIQWENMRKSHISEHDLMESLRLNAQLTHASKAQMACLEVLSPANTSRRLSSHCRSGCTDHTDRTEISSEQEGDEGLIRYWVKS